MNKAESNWEQNDEEWNELFNNMLEDMKNEYFQKYGIECKIFDINLQDQMSEEEKERLITQLRDWIKNGKGDLLSFFQTYFKDMRPSQILQYLDLLESLLPDNNTTRCVICFRMIDEHNITELTDCISVHQTILQEIYKARLQKKVVNIWMNKNEEKEMKEKTGEIPKSINNKLKSKLNKIRKKKSIVNDNNDNTHEDIQISNKLNYTKVNNIEEKEKNKEKDKNDNTQSNNKPTKDTKKNKNKNEKKQQSQQQEQKDEQITKVESKQKKSNPYEFFNANENNIETIISENYKIKNKKRKVDNKFYTTTVESLLKSQNQNFSPIPNISPNITLNTPSNLETSANTPFSFSENNKPKNSKKKKINSNEKEKRFKTTTSTTTATKQKSKKLKKESDNDNDYDIIPETEITDNWEYYVCDMKNTNKIICKQCKKKILSHSFEELIVCSGRIKESKKYLKFITTLKRQENERKQKEKNNKKINNNSGEMKKVKEKKKIRSQSNDTYNSETTSVTSSATSSTTSNTNFKFNENNNESISITPMLQPKRLLDNLSPSLSPTDVYVSSSTTTKTVNLKQLLASTPSNQSYSSQLLLTPNSTSNRSMRLSQIYKNTIANEENNNNNSSEEHHHNKVNTIKPLLNKTPPTTPTLKEEKSFKKNNNISLNHHQPSPLINEYISKSNSNSTPNTPKENIEIDKYGNTLVIPPQLENESEEDSKNRVLLQLDKLQIKKSKSSVISNNNGILNASIKRSQTTTNLQSNESPQLLTSEQNSKILKSKRLEQLINEEAPLESLKQTFKYNKNNNSNKPQIEIPDDGKVHGRDSIFKMKLEAEVSNNNNNNNNQLLSVRSNTSNASKMSISSAPSRIISTPITNNNNYKSLTPKSPTNKSLLNQYQSNKNKSENENNNICPFCKKQIVEHSYDELENCLAKESDGIESNV